MKKQRKHYTAEEKVAILRRHLLEQEPISKLCDELGLQPTVFYRWKKGFCENGAAAFQAKARTGHQAEQERIEYLEKKIQRKDEVLAELMGEHIALKKVLGNSEPGLGGARRAGSDRRYVGWLGVTTSKFYDWRERYGRVNEHNGWVPRDFWLEDGEKQAIIAFHLKNPLEGYRRLTFMMLDADIVAVSPSSVWRVLGQAGLKLKLGSWGIVCVKRKLLYYPTILQQFTVTFLSADQEFGPIRRIAKKGDHLRWTNSFLRKILR